MRAGGTRRGPAHARFRAALVAVVALAALAPRSWAQVRVEGEAGEGATLDLGGHARLGALGFLTVEGAALSGGSPPLTSEADVRFADLVAHGSTLGGRITAFAVYDFRNRVRPVEDLWVTAQPLGPAAPEPGRERGLAVTVGNHKDPFSMQALNGSPQRVLVEAALPQALSTGRHAGLSVGAWGPRWTATAGAFGGDVNGDVADGSASIGARATWAPVRRGRRVIAVGLSVNRRRGESDPTFAAFPETVRTDRPLVATGPVTGARAVTRLAAEAAWREGPLLVQAEVAAARVERPGRPDPVFVGGYANASHVLWGGPRPYLVSANPNERGTFGALPVGRPLRAGGPGAVEVVARLSALDLASADVRAGSLWAASAGLTWHADPSLQLSLTAVAARTREPAVGPDEPGDERLRALLVRVLTFL